MMTFYKSFLSLILLPRNNLRCVHYILFNSPIFDYFRIHYNTFVALYIMHMLSKSRVNLTTIICMITEFVQDFESSDDNEERIVGDF